MITFYYTPECFECFEIEKFLEKKRLLHESIVVSNAEEKKKHFSNNLALPILKDEHVVFSGIEAILEYLHETHGVHFGEMLWTGEKCTCQVHA